MTKSTRFYQYSASAAGKRNSRRHSTPSYCENVKDKQKEAKAGYQMQRSFISLRSGELIKITVLIFLGVYF